MADLNASNNPKPPAAKATVESGYLKLPYDQEQFQSFIKGLLGRPQTISRTIRGPFEIRVADIVNLHQLIQQRMAQQNEGILAAFNARVNYSDNSTVELTGVPELVSYNEVRPLWVRGIHLKWDYLVRFLDKEIPEKQSVQISFVGSAEGVPIFDGESIIVLSSGAHSGSPGIISFRVEHTARTWGADIEALLSAHLQALVHPESSYKCWLRKHSSRISLTVGVGFFVVVVTGLFVTTRRFATGQIAAVNSLLAAGKSTPDLTVAYLTRFVAGGAWSQYYFAVVVFLALAIFVAIWLGIWAENTANTTEPSFLLLTRESEKHKKQVLEKLKKKHYSFIGSVVSSLALGVISNIIFAKLFN